MVPRVARQSPGPTRGALQTGVTTEPAARGAGCREGRHGEGGTDLGGPESLYTVEEEGKRVFILEFCFTCKSG